MMQLFNHVLRGLRHISRRSGEFEGRFWVALVLIGPVIYLVLLCLVPLSPVWGILERYNATPLGIIRDLTLVVGVPTTILLAIWRSRIGERQAATAYRGLLNERYQKATEMLGNSLLTVRVGGIYSLQTLATEHPRLYHTQVMRQLCIFVKNPIGEENLLTKYAGENNFYRLREDLQEAMTFIGCRSGEQIKLEQKDGYVPDLSGAYLKCLSLERANLSGVRLGGADLTGAYLIHANLSQARLAHAHLSGATLTFANLSGSILREADLSSAKLQSSILSGATLDGADLSGAKLDNACLYEATLHGTILSGTDFSHNAQAPAKGLTQTQLDGARAVDGNPPDLARVVDVRTGKSLELRRRNLPS